MKGRVENIVHKNAATAAQTGLDVKKEMFLKHYFFLMNFYTALLGDPCLVCVVCVNISCTLIHSYSLLTQGLT